MKRIFLISALFVSLSVSAQYTPFNPDAVTSATQQASAKDAQTPKAKPAKPVMMIKEKYAAGSCPEVDGKVVWSKTFSCSPLTAQQVYDKMIAFLQDYCKQEGKDPISRIAIVNKEAHEIGARISEYVTFREGLLRDRALLNYTLRVNCFDGKCEVIMNNMSYTYDSKFPAEEMLLDKNALNKTQTKFNKGGYEKFRTKTIDTKDALMAQIEAALK
ncbi:MAG: DUF4468 domain-containing protein [Prevotella sp.]|nr:DUF4468 domain-containing protein [Prevotella sp.]